MIVEFTYVTGISKGDTPLMNLRIFFWPFALKMSLGSKTATGVHPMGPPFFLKHEQHSGTKDLQSLELWIEATEKSRSYVVKSSSFRFTQTPDNNRKDVF